MRHDKENLRIILFVAVVLFLTFGIELLFITPMAQREGYGTSPKVQLIVAACMFLPALSVLITRLATREGFNDCKLKPNFKGNIKYYLSAWFSMPVLCALTALIYFLIFPDRFDPCSGFIVAQSAEKGVTLTPSMLRLTIISQCATAVLFGPILNFIPCLGEEWGWRGYLLPKLLKKMSFPAAVILSGFIWGIWHAPLIALGHNYGTEYCGAPWLGIAMMCLFCIALGTLLGWVTVKTDSCIPAVLAHASVNAIAAAPLFFVSDNTHTLIGPALSGIIGIIVLSLLSAPLWLGHRRCGLHR